MAWDSNTSGTAGVSRLGNASNNSPDSTTRALFLKQFAGEVLTTFEEKNVFMPLHRVRTIKNGKSAQFPSIGTSSAAYHKAGEVIFGDSIAASEITVTVDDLLVSAAFIPKIDEAMNHYDVRSIYSSELGNALANAADKNIAKVIYNSATKTSTGDQEGVWTANANGMSATAGKIDLSSDGTLTGAELVSGIYTALEAFDSHDVDGEKVVVLTPDAYYALFGAQASADQTPWLNRDVGGAGSISQGVVPMIGGCKVYMSNHLPTTDESSTSATPTAEANNFGDYTTSSSAVGTKGLIFTKDAAATVKLLDLGVESEYQIDRQGTLMVAKYAMGHNILRPASAIALMSA